jgi:cyclic pyranopterin phosphate synthase
VLRALAAPRAEGFRIIKINMVVLSDVDDADIDAMVEYCAARGFCLRLIETMPVGMTARRAGSVDLQPIRERLRARFGLLDGLVPGGGPARYLLSPDGRCQVGFITPMSQHFCETCNRVRLGVDGMLYSCLGHEDAVDLRSSMRAGCSDDDIEALTRVALLVKPARHEFREQPDRIVRIMASTGG